MFTIYEGDIAELVGEKMIVKVNSSGQKTKRKKCQSGFKLSADGRSCVKIAAREKLNRSKGAKRSKIKRRSGQAATKRKRLKAVKHRRRLGL